MFYSSDTVAVHKSEATPHDVSSVPSGPCRILSDWLEVKLGSDGVLDSAAEQLDGTLRSVCVSDTLLEKDECRVYVSIKVRVIRVHQVSGSLLLPVTFTVFIANSAF